jgi:hypothetical protein
VRRLAMWAVCLLIGALVAGELGARYILGLGDPPLFLLDPEMEYLLKPGQKCRRFGHDYLVNAESMRSDEFAAKKPVGQLRVMVIGDSVVNGGGKIDQSELATTILQRELAASLKRDVVVGNISAPSWGPPNQLAYAKRFGLFDADVVIIVSNSDDWDDVPGQEYIGSAWPREKPWCALQELIGVYGWKALRRAIGRAPEPPPPVRIPPTTHDEDVDRCRMAYGELLAVAQSSGAKVVVVQYLMRSELRPKLLKGGAGGVQQGFGAIRSWAKAAGIEPVPTAGTFGPGAIGAPGATDPYQSGDDIHPNAYGHKLLAELLKKIVEKEIADLPAAGASQTTPETSPRAAPPKAP